MMQATVSVNEKPNWFIRRGIGPVMTTAVHAGHVIRDELKPFLNPDAGIYRREEDPLTDIWASLGDQVFWPYNSRFEVDLNRPRERALSARAEDTWGLPIWKKPPPADAIERSLVQHDEFYELMTRWLQALINTHGKVLLIDIHSYNHRRHGRDEAPSSAQDNPDIDLGFTTFDHARFGDLAARFQGALASHKTGGKFFDVRENVRYPDGGHWPEWVYARFPEHICTITVEYKKMYMDEWTGTADLNRVEDIRAGLANAIGVAREALAKCR